ncbi:MAG: hypothetical protein ACK5YQ_00665, partial [Betaproteobacteria bacterium]
MKLPHCVVTVLLAGTLCAAPAFGQGVRTIQWQDLAPKASLFDDPFEKLSREQLFALADVAGVRDRRERGDKTITAEESAREQAAAKKLAAAGVDVGGLLAQRKDIAVRRKAQGEAVNTAL